MNVLLGVLSVIGAAYMVVVVVVVVKALNMAEGPTTNASLQNDALYCPECTSPLVRRSHRKNEIDIVVSWFGYFPFRCQYCHCRFFRRREELPAQYEASAPLRTYQVRQTVQRRGHLDRRKTIRSTPDRRRRPADRRQAITA